MFGCRRHRAAKEASQAVDADSTSISREGLLAGPSDNSCPRRLFRSVLSRWSVMLSVVAGASVASIGAYGLSNWGVALAGGSSSQAQSASVANLMMAPEATPTATNVLYPGATGDVVVLITNPNQFPVTITGVELPLDTTFASGFTSSSLNVVESGCSSTTSDVFWSFAGASSGAVHALIAPLTVGATRRSASRSPTTRP